MTGQCTIYVPSNVSDPTGLCLNTFANLQAVLHTYDSAVVTANQGNPIWEALGKPAVDAIEVPSNPVLQRPRRIPITNLKFFVFPSSKIKSKDLLVISSKKLNFTSLR
ncbi:MAG: hypothetical protein ASUL_09134 [Candidatus Aramenus sulfurataquae]|uniref:Uncharacterized protein n=1 Tax=Candidatus Aramenus sulfurataquae TaxID=1326980 RepID=W7KJU7_9CREN|nr:MAG: hypothetical protein ASUL_09134 [Candidatus Aramenus sulfurataquae]